MGLLMKNNFLDKNEFALLEKKIKDYLNSIERKDLGIIGSVRTTGDKIPQVLSNKLETFISKKTKDFIYNQNRKAMANFEFIDHEDYHYYINVVTHCMDLRMSMPNITSVNRLFNLYDNDKNYFIILLIDYYKSRKTNFISSVKLIPIEFLSLDSLGFGAIGSGQIQIKKAGAILILNQNRKKWMIGFAEKLSEFYSKLNRTTANRLDNTIRLKNEWNNRKDIWT